MRSPRVKPSLAAAAACWAVAVAGAAGVAAEETAGAEGEPVGRRAVAEYLVRATRTSLLGADEFYQPEFEIFRDTQAAYVRAPFVLTAAVGRPKIAELPLLKEQEDPARWLGETLRVHFPNGGEVMRITLSHPTAPAEELKAIVEAVSAAYWDEVVFRERMRRARAVPILRKSLAKTKSELADKLEQAWRLAADAGAGGPDGAERQRLLAEYQSLVDARLDAERESRLMQRDAGRADAFKGWLAELETRTGDLRERIDAGSSIEPDLAMLRHEIDRLRSFAATLDERLRRIEIEQQGPPRVAAIGPRPSGAAAAAFFEEGE